MPYFQKHLRVPKYRWTVVIREYQALLVRKSSPGCFNMSAYKDITSMVMCPDVSENTNASLRIDNLSYNGLYYQCANATAGCEHQKQRTQKQHIRVRIRIHLHKLPCRSIASIGVRTLNVSRHRSSQLAFLSACHCNVLHPPWVKEGKRRGNNKSWVFPIEPDNGHRPYFHGLQCLV